MPPSPVSRNWQWLGSQVMLGIRWYPGTYQQPRGSLCLYLETHEGQREDSSYARDHSAWHGPHTHRYTITPARIEGTVGVRAYLGRTFSCGMKAAVRGSQEASSSLPSAPPLLQAPQQCKPVPFLVLSRTAWYSSPALDCTYGIS